MTALQLKTNDFDYDLPPECIAQTPLEPRDSARLLILDRSKADLQHAYFYELGQFLQPGDMLVLNETRVIPARLYARKLPTGGRIEVLLLRRLDESTWEALVSGKRLVMGKRFQVEDGPQGEVLKALDGARRLIHFDQALDPFLGRAGHMPLPPYIHTPLQNPERYQTVYARQPGSAAAPTAGLHFTPRLMENLHQQGIRFATITLHVGLDTFAPVTEEVPEEHKIHTEWCQVTNKTAQAINQTYHQGGRIIAVGTTAVRSLETAALMADQENIVGAFEGPTNLYILPGYRFHAVQAIITNFHLPRSTLIMLISAFAGRQRVLDTYLAAMDMGYRFYSFGDAMLIT